MKRSTYLLVAAMLAGPPALAQDIPRFDLQKTCGVVGNGAEESSRGCVASEQDARAQLERRWTSFKPDTRRTCAQETQIGGSPSYVEVLTCLELAEGNLQPTPQTRAAPAEQTTSQKPAAR